MVGPTKVIAGSTGVFVTVRIMGDAGHATPGEPVTGLDASGIDISYWRQGAASVVALTEADGTALNDAHDPSDVFEIGLGYYLVHVPDAAFEVGAAFVQVMATGTDAVGYGPCVTLTDPVGALLGSEVIASEPSTSVARVAAFATYAADQLNDELVWVYDKSADKWFPCYVDDFDPTSGGDVTLVYAVTGGNIPFTIEDGADRIWRSGITRAGLFDRYFGVPIDVTVDDSVVTPTASVFDVDQDALSQVRVGVLRFVDGALAGEARLVHWTGTSFEVADPDSSIAGLAEVGPFSAAPADGVAAVFLPLS